jgi:hypothetical protein
LLTPLLVRLGATIAVTAGVLLAVHTLPLSRLRDGRWALPLALGVGYATGHALMRGWPPLPPLEAMDWLVYLALAAGLGGGFVTAAEPPWRPVSRWSGRVVLSALSLGVLLGPVVGADGAVSLTVLALFELIWVASWTIAAAQADRLGPEVAPSLVLIAAGAALVLGLSGSVMLAALGGVAAAALGSAWAVGRLVPGLIWNRGAVGVAVTVVAGLLTVGLVYVEVPLVCALLLVAAPAAMWVDRPAAMSRLSTRSRSLLRVSAVGLVTAVAVAVAAWFSPSAPY